MTYTLKYGHNHISFSLPPSVTAHEMKAPTAPTAVAEKTIVEHALDQPLNSERLEEIVRKGESTCIVVPDRTRACQAHIFLPILIQRLNRCGISDNDIKIIMANGSHRANTAAEREEILGKDICSRISVIEHDATDAANLVHLGQTRSGTEVYVNKALIRAERLILTGGVLHHYFAGFGGGPKLVVPGCAGYETITHNHSHTIHPIFPALHPDCREGNLDNPVHNDIRDALKFVSVDFVLNVITRADGEISAAFAGELNAAHQSACASAHTQHRLPLPFSANLVVASSGGYPKDINLIQVHKALHHAYQAVKPGGTIILLAECSDGIGSQTFLEWYEGNPDLTEMHQRLRENFKINGNTALALKQKTLATRVILISALEPELVQQLGMMPATNIKAAIELAMSQIPDNPTAIVFPNAAFYLPQHKSTAHTFSAEQRADLLAEAEIFVKQQLGRDCTGHDWYHAWRVGELARKIAAVEGGDLLTIELASLLHDVIDWKHIDESNPVERNLVRDWLGIHQLPREMLTHICTIIDTMSYKGAGVVTEMSSLEGQIVQDADRLDAMGAIGIARTFSFGGAHNRCIYEPALKPQFHQSETAYRERESSSLNHFYEKLLLINERLNTKTARKIGAKRHLFLEKYLEEFLKEWPGNDVLNAPI